MPQNEPGGSEEDVFGEGDALLRFQEAMREYRAGRAGRTRVDNTFIGEPFPDDTHVDRLVVGGFTAANETTNQLDVEPAFSEDRSIAGIPVTTGTSFYPSPTSVPTPSGDWHIEMRSPKGLAKQARAETPKARIEATRKLLNKYDRSPNLRPYSNRRERDYIALIQDHANRNRTTYDMLHSELPVFVYYLERAQLQELPTLTEDVFFNEKKEIEIRCHTSHDVVSLDHAFMCGGHVYASEHVPQLELCASCTIVRDDCKLVTDYQNKPMYICAECMFMKKRCANCSCVLLVDLLGLGVCMTCVETVDSERPTRDFYRGVRWMGDSPGEIVQSNRVFSFEMEAVIDHDQVGKLGTTLPTEAGLSGDGSITPVHGMGVEVQSPRLRGVRGEEFVSRTSAAFKSVGATLNDSCGMHIHLDGADLIPYSRSEYPQALIQLWQAYLVFEDVIFSFVPYDRRINAFCRPLREYFKVTEVEFAQSMYDLEKLWYKQQNSRSLSTEKQHHHHASRYFGVNFHSLLGPGKHLEIRHHSATTNAKKVLHWANLHALIMDASVKGLFTPDVLQDAQARSSLKDKTKALFALIGLSKSSQTYFMERQKRFSDKGHLEDGVLKISRPTIQQRRTYQMMSEGLIVTIMDNDN